MSLNTRLVINLLVAFATGVGFYGIWTKKCSKRYEEEIDDVVVWLWSDVLKSDSKANNSNVAKEDVPAAATRETTDTAQTSSNVGDYYYYNQQIMDYFVFVS